jgi:hypothetical protein
MDPHRRRSVTFAGLLHPGERWRLWRETRDRFTARP